MQPRRAKIHDIKRQFGAAVLDVRGFARGQETLAVCPYIEPLQNRSSRIDGASLDAFNVFAGGLWMRPSSAGRRHAAYVWTSSRILELNMQFP